MRTRQRRTVQSASEQERRQLRAQRRLDRDGHDEVRSEEQPALQRDQRNRREVRGKAREEEQQRKRVQAEERPEIRDEKRQFDAKEREQRRAERLRERETKEAARRERFAARFDEKLRKEHRREWRRARESKLAARRAWRAGHRAAFVPHVHRLYWPYVYSDVFYYTFWPHGYVPGYWAFVYDDFLDAVFWRDRAPYSPYLYAHAGRRAVGGRATAQARRDARLADALCADPGRGVTAWPFTRIEKAVQPNPNQQELLERVRAAAAAAAEEFKASCPTSFAWTPPARLDQMAARIEATLEAVRTVRPTLVEFYGSLSDEQKARFNEIGPRPRKSDDLAVVEDRKACDEPRPGLATLPIDQIEDIVRPTEAQQAAFHQLGQATEKAVATLRAACPAIVPETPVGRLEAMENWLTAMLEAARAVQPALAGFYDALNDEQKSRFNTLGRQLAETEG